MIDAEHALDAAYAQKLGVDIANLHVAQPDTAKEALEIADHLVRSGAVDVVVVDSVAALVPAAEIEAEWRIARRPAGAADVAGPGTVCSAPPGRERRRTRRRRASLRPGRARAVA